MRDWKKNMEILCDPLCRQVQIACHRGKFSSSVMENTALAFQAAVGQGADMVEMDLARTKDGRIVGHHDDTMIRLFHNPGRIGDYTLEELKNMELYNYLGEPCVESIETFDEILDALRDRTILVLDKCWDCWDEVLELLEREGMTGQAVFKFYIEDEAAWQWAARHENCLFIPMLGDTGYLDRVAELAGKTRVPALEILPERETDAVFREETILWLRERGIKTWCNSLSLSKNLVYGAGYDDLKSLRFGGDAGWGRLIRQGVDIIQTDWPYELWRYLKEGDSL